MGVSGKMTSTAVPNILKQFKKGTLPDGEDTPIQANENEEDEVSEEEDRSGSELGYEVEMDELEAIMEEVSSTFQEKIENIVTQAVTKERERLEADDDGSLHIHTMKWTTKRIEIILSNNDDIEFPEGPPMNAIQRIHKAVYAELELRDEELDFINSYELLVASPGVRDELHIDRDFMSFRGFPVTVTTTEEYKKKTEFKGTLIERDEDFVRISAKGRVTKIPRAICKSVTLPKSKVESTDLEMKKLN